GAIIDLEATSGVAGVAAGAFLVSDEPGGADSGRAASSRGFSVSAATVVAAGPATGGGSSEADCGSRAVEGEGLACGKPGAEFWRPIEPVTLSRPCSSTVTREYSRSRSPFKVSMADASRRASAWLSLATDWICWDCRVKSADAIWSRRAPIDDWLAMI